MATTTNYGWTTPDDTGLVKDGASAIRSLGTSVDTTTKNLNPSTTLGDIEYRSSTANTNTRLGIGTTGQVLTVSGGVPSWATSSAGGMTLLSTTTLSASLTNITSISQSYNNLQIELSDVYATSGNGPIQVRLNGSNGLHFGLAEFNVGGSTITQYSTDAVIYLWNNSGTQYYSSTRRVNASVDVYNYTSANLNKSYAYCGAYTDTSSTTRSGGYGGGAYWDATAITSVSIYNDNTVNGTVKIWGIK